MSKQVVYRGVKGLPATGEPWAIQNVVPPEEDGYVYWSRELDDAHEDVEIARSAMECRRSLGKITSPISRDGE